jgi:hypothetical protein
LQHLLFIALTKKKKCVLKLMLNLQLPQIDWSKYQHVMPKEMNRPFTRTKKVVLERPSDSSNNADDSTSDDGKVLIRGRAFDDSKPETFNQVSFNLCFFL